MAEPTTEVEVFDVEHPNVIDMHEKVIEQNRELIGRLAVVGKAPSMALMHELSIDQLVGMLFDDNGKKLFELGVDIRLNKSLKATLAETAGQLVVP